MKAFSVLVGNAFFNFLLSVCKKEFLGQVASLKYGSQAGVIFLYNL